LPTNKPLPGTSGDGSQEQEKEEVEFIVDDAYASAYALVSPYEEQRRKNIEAKMMMYKELGLDEAKSKTKRVVKIGASRGPGVVPQKKTTPMRKVGLPECLF
jgi:hypothetical protein